MRAFVSASVRLFVRLLVGPFACFFVRSFVSLIGPTFVRLFVRSFVCLSVCGCLSVCFFAWLFVR